MGALDFCFPGFFSCFIIFQVHEACIFTDMHYDPFVHLHENYKTSKKEQKKQATNASSIIIVKLLVFRNVIFLFLQWMYILKSEYYWNCFTPNWNRWLSSLPCLDAWKSLFCRNSSKDCLMSPKQVSTPCLIVDGILHLQQLQNFTFYPLKLLLLFLLNDWII